MSGTRGDVLYDHDLAEAIVDWALERGRLLALDGPSCRTRHPGLDNADLTRYDKDDIGGEQMKPVISDAGFGYITIERSKIEHDIVIRLSGETKKRKKKVTAQVVF